MKFRFAISFLVLGAALAQSPGMLKVQGVLQQLQNSYNVRQSGGKPEKVAFQFTEAELNEYFVHALKTNPRPGLDSVQLKFFPGNYISTYSVVNFDAVEQWKPGTIPTLLKPVLNGKKAVWVDLRVRAQDSKGTFSIEKAYFGSIRIPALVVEKMMQVIASRQPEHYDLSKPVPLPFALRQIWTAEQKIGGENY